MQFKLNGIDIPIQVYNNYLNSCINKVFKILPIYENCVLKKDKTDFDSYLDKMITLFIGGRTLFEEKNYIEYLDILNLLKGMQEEDLTHSQMKSLVFHCIDIIDKMKVPVEVTK